MENSRKRDPKKASRVHRTAEITGVTTDEVYKVIREDRKNDVVLAIYMEILENEKEKDSELLEAVKKLVPFN